MKIGILGAGKIAHKMAETIVKMNHEDIQLYAIGASDLNRAQQFAKCYNIEKAYGNYEDFVQDNNIDLVYIATIHPLHYTHALLCIKHHKHVLIEKPMTISVEQAKKLYTLAKEYNVLAIEAMWTRFMPSAHYFKQLQQSNIIGTITSVVANIGYNLIDVERMIKLEYAGGALYDIGIYPIHFAMMVFNQLPKEVLGACTKLESGVDAIDTIVMKWDHAQASLHATMLSDNDNRGIIYGSKGYVEVDNINNPQTVKVFKNGKCEEVIDFSNMITGFEYEVLACYETIMNNKIIYDNYTQQDSLQVLKYMEQLRNQWGIVFNNEKA